MLYLNGPSQFNKVYDTTEYQVPFIYGTIYALFLLRILKLVVMTAVMSRLMILSSEQRWVSFYKSYQSYHYKNRF
jgi:hypothetical protein